MTRPPTPPVSKGAFLPAARLAVYAAALLATPASAERGLFAFSLEGGPTLDGAIAQRSLALVGTSEYGLAERWALAGSAGVELSSAKPSFNAGLGPRLALLQAEWTTLQAFVLPELLSSSQAGQVRPDLGLRAGVTFRYQFMWGVGFALQASVRGRDSAGSPDLRWQGLLLCGLFIEA